MACNFTITFTGTANDVVARAKAKVLAQQGTFNGDTSSGTFYVPIPLSHIDGSYTINGQQMTIIISHKPFALSCNKIQEFVENELGN